MELSAVRSLTILLLWSLGVKVLVVAESSGLAHNDVVTAAASRSKRLALFPQFTVLQVSESKYSWK